MSPRIAFLTATVALAAVAMPVHTARAADDFKFVHAADCVPYAPNTQPADLQLTPAGYYNPGVTVERLLCPMPRDQDDAYLSGDVDITAYYRGMTATPGRLTCTLYVGSSSMTTSVYAQTVSGPYAANGARTTLVISGAGQPGGFLTAPVGVLCSLDPKMAFAGLFFNESGPTNFP
jgi:hypothetical protein